MPDKYHLIKVKDDTLYILDRGLSFEDVYGYNFVRSEDDCDRMSSDTVYAISDTGMSRVFGR